MDDHRTSGEKEHQILPVLQRALPRPDLHGPTAPQGGLLQLHTHPAVRPPIIAHPSVVLASAGVARKDGARCVRLLRLMVHSRRCRNYYRRTMMLMLCCATAVYNHVESCNCYM